MTDLIETLQAFYTAKLTEMLRHQAGAQLIDQYDINNAYQYIVNRDETHLTWVRAAVEGLGATVTDTMDPHAAVRRSTTAHAILEEDALAAWAFIEEWTPKLEQIANARHRGMLQVILGEAAEQARSFEQALAGELDVLGRRTPGVGARLGTVLPTRWVG